MNTFENVGSGPTHPAEDGLEPREIEAVFTAEIDSALAEVAALARQVEVLAASLAQQRRDNPDADFGYEGDLEGLLQQARNKLDALMDNMIKRGTARGSKPENQTGELFDK